MKIKIPISKETNISSIKRQMSTAIVRGHNQVGVSHGNKMKSRVVKYTPCELECKIYTWWIQ